MLCMSQESPVMKPGCKMKDFADEVVLAKSAFVFDNSQYLCATNRMFNFDSCFGYLCVGLFLLRGKFLSSGLLHWLDNGYIVGRITLIAGVLLKNALVRKRIHCVGNLLVVHLALDSGTAEEDEPCHTGDYRILDGVLLFLSAVIFLLKIRVGRSWNLPLISSKRDTLTLVSAKNEVGLVLIFE